MLFPCSFLHVTAIFFFFLYTLFISNYINSLLSVYLIMLRNPTQESREEADSSESSLLDRKQVSPNQHDDTDLHSSASDSYSQIPRYPSQPSGNNHEEHNYSERTPLLDPDDPAVSPLNLPGVQAMRIILAVMLALTYFWTILLFINCFVSVPFMKLRTSGFLELE